MGLLWVSVNDRLLSFKTGSLCFELLKSERCVVIKRFVKVVNMSYRCSFTF